MGDWYAACYALMEHLKAFLQSSLENGDSPGHSCWTLHLKMPHLAPNLYNNEIGIV